MCFLRVIGTKREQTVNLRVKTLYPAPLSAIIGADSVGACRSGNEIDEQAMTLKRILCALLCALMLASIPALAEETAEAVPAEETAVEETAADEAAEEAPLTEADKDARIAELEAQVAELHLMAVA